MKNYWLYRKQKRLISKELNIILKKFEGRPLNPVDALYSAMKKEVAKYFIINKTKLKYLDNHFNYNIEVEEKGNKVYKVNFEFT
jgi:hypothetical protein